MTRFIACLLMMLVCRSAFSEDIWRAGTARVELTPENAIAMAGYGARNLPAEGTLSGLWGKALAIEDARGNRGVLITLDLVGIHRDTTQQIFDQVQRRYGLSRDQLAINCSHTHTGPAVGKNLGPLHYYLLPDTQRVELDEYETELIANLVDLVGAAIDDLEDCTLTYGSGLCTVAVNRRNNSQAEVPSRRQLGTLVGPYDHSVPVLAIRDCNLKLKAMVFGYACHATVLNLRQWSGDYPGFAQQTLEALYPETTAMFWAGCGADQNPVPRREVELAREYGERLANSVAEIIEGTVRPVGPRLTTRYREIELPLQGVPSVAELRKTSKQSEQRYEQARANYLLARLGDQSSVPTSYPYPVATWLLGDDLRLVFLGGEVVVDYALQIKLDAMEAAAEPGGSVWVAGYSNDVMAYIPSRRVLREGGYEGGGSNVYYGLPGLWSPEIERQILDEVESQAAPGRAAAR